MVFAAALFSSRTKIPHTMILLGFGISISLLYLTGLLDPIIVNFSQFKINPNLVITFIIPPLIFEAMMKVDYKQFKAIRISALLRATLTNAYVLSPLNLNKETSFAEVEHMIYDIIKSSPSIDDVHGIGEIIRTSNQSIMQIHNRSIYSLTNFE
jgi:hypothetical protein